MKISAAPAGNDNPGVVPPWLGRPETAGQNPGIVPPWLAGNDFGAQDPGIVPPWLTGAPLTSPNAQVTTAFVR